MDTQKAIRLATKHLLSLAGHKFDVLTVAKPINWEAATNLAKVISKLSPMLGNLIEFNTCQFLNAESQFRPHGKWKRQDPGLPDAIFEGTISPAPGFEIKAWFPLATEITARFKDSQQAFLQNNTYVAMLAWLPNHLIYGTPCIQDVVVVSAASIAKARDEHYHNPPDYLVLEPEDTSKRTKNLQQTNTSGHKFQGSDKDFAKAQSIVDSWGKNGTKYRYDREYQAQLRQLTSRFNYRGDTNYAKMDRIVHADIEKFKARVLSSEVNGLSVAKWAKVLATEDEALLRQMLSTHLEIKEESADSLVE